MIRIGVGSKNPVKHQSVKNAASKYWDNFEVISINVSSGVSEQPKNDYEGIQGALNRAKSILDQTSVDIGVGLEGNFFENDFGYFMAGWVVAADKEGTIGIGSSGSILLPEIIAY